MRQITYEEIPEGRDGAIKTCSDAMEMAYIDSLNPNVIHKAQAICHSYSCNPHDARDMANMLFYWVKENLRYIPDPHGAEKVSAPRHVLQDGYGDCDDLAGTFVCLCMAVGCPARLCLISYVRQNIRMWHVYPEILIGNEWVSYDVSYPESFPGWSPPHEEVESRYYISPDLEVEQVGGFLDSIVDFFKDIGDLIKKMYTGNLWKNLQRLNPLEMFASLSERKKAIKALKRFRDKLLLMTKGEQVFLYGLKGEGDGINSLLPMQQEAKRVLTAAEERNSQTVAAEEERFKAEMNARLNRFGDELTEALKNHTDRKLLVARRQFLEQS